MANSKLTKAMRRFCMAYPPQKISETPSRISSLVDLTKAFPLSWSHMILPKEKQLAGKIQSARKVLEDQKKLSA